MPQPETNTPAVVSRIRAFRDSQRMIKNPIEVFDKYTARFGETFVFYFGGVKKAVVSSNPVVMRHVLKTNYDNYHKSDIQMKRMRHFLGHGLLTSHGESWLRQRRLIQQGFHKDRLASLASTMHECLGESLERFDKEIQHGHVEICTEMKKMTFRMVSRSLFSTRLRDEDVDFISETISTIQEFMVRQIVQPYLDPWFALSGELRKHEATRALGDRIVLDYIKTRRREGGEHQDLLQILLDAKYGDTGEGMSDEQVLSESMQLLVAGHETSSNALAWTLYLLSKHPECIEKIRREINAVVGDAPFQFCDIQKLEVTTQILEESLRLYPPFWMLDRVSLADDQIMDLAIPKGTMVITYIYGAHHAAQYWKDPERFVPGRFSKENKESHTAFAYLPFGGGPRGCIGGNYAIFQMLMILSILIINYDFSLLPNQIIEARPMIMLRPKDGIKMSFTKTGAR
jgi:cytochrome P450